MRQMKECHIRKNGPLQPVSIEFNVSRELLTWEIVVERRISSLLLQCTVYSSRRSVDAVHGSGLTTGR